jgi:predicted RNA-binding Zn-ribbon protein involved in translation (DUF1610 family)
MKKEKRSKTRQTTTVKFCRYDEMYAEWFECKNCGDSYITEIANFCPNCGLKIIKKEKLDDQD